MTPIQFGHIELDGVTYPVKFGTAQTRDYCKALGCELKDYNALLTEKLFKLETSGEEVITLVWSALKQGARVEGTEFTLSQDDVADLIDYMNANAHKWTELFGILQDATGEAPRPNAQPETAPVLKATA